MRHLPIAAIAAAFTFAWAHSAPASDGPPPYNWTGPYAGIAAGYGWGHSSQTDSGIPCNFYNTCPVSDEGTGGTPEGTGEGTPEGTGEGAEELVGDGSYTMRGGLIGGSLGYNWQAGSWVFGLEGDYSLANIGGGSSTCGAASPLPHPCATRIESLGTLRGRVGWAVGATGKWLPYLTGGLAVGQIKASDALLPASGRDFRTGWTVGGGLEVVLAPSWTAKAEYLYVDLGKRRTFEIVPGVQETVSVSASIFRAGINHKSY